MNYVFDITALKATEFAQFLEIYVEGETDNKVIIPRLEYEEVSVRGIRSLRISIDKQISSGRVVVVDHPDTSSFGKACVMVARSISEQVEGVTQSKCVAMHFNKAGIIPYRLNRSGFLCEYNSDELIKNNIVWNNNDGWNTLGTLQAMGY